MTDQAQPSRNPLLVPVWIIALVLIGAVIFGVVVLVQHQAAERERDQYRKQAEDYCFGNAPLGEESKCIEDTIDDLVRTNGGLG